MSVRWVGSEGHRSFDYCILTGRSSGKRLVAPAKGNFLDSFAAHDYKNKVFSEN
jgi:hypothetical protein